jgi:hypothetical protein
VAYANVCQSDTPVGKARNLCWVLPALGAMIALLGLYTTLGLPVALIFAWAFTLFP